MKKESLESAWAPSMVSLVDSAHTSPQFAWATLFERLLSGPMLVWLFVALSLPATIFLAVATPPLQTPDAPNHFFRAYQVSRGVLIGRHVQDSSGGMIDSGVLAFGQFEDPLKFHAERKWTQALADEIAAVRFTGDEQSAIFGNTAPYPPVNYMPQALAFVLLGHEHVRVLTVYRLACLLNAICAIVLTACALRFAVRTRALIFSVALLPMTQSLMASVSQDATLIAQGFLIIAWFDHLCALRRSVTARSASVLSVLLVVTAIARIPYLAFVLLVFHPALRLFGEGYRWKKRLIWAGSVFIVSALLYLLQTHLAGGAMRPDRSMYGQTVYLLTHISAIPELLWRTLQVYGKFYVQTFVGVLGWIDTYFPRNVYAATYVVILLALLYPALDRDYLVPGVRQRLGALWPLLPFVAALALIFYGLYAFWSAVGAPEIEGVQGRYFLPVFPLLAMAITPLLRPAISGARIVVWVRGVCAFVFLVFPLVLFFETIQVVLERFYLG